MQQAVNTMENAEPCFKCWINSSWLFQLFARAALVAVKPNRSNEAAWEKKKKKKNSQPEMLADTLGTLIEHCVRVGGGARVKKSRMWWVLPFLCFAGYGFFFLAFFLLLFSRGPCEWICSPAVHIRTSAAAASLQLSHANKLREASASLVWRLPKNAKHRRSESVKEDVGGERCMCFWPRQCFTLLCRSSVCDDVLQLGWGNFCTCEKPQTPSEHLKLPPLPRLRQPNWLIYVRMCVQ